MPIEESNMQWRLMEWIWRKVESEKKLSEFWEDLGKVIDIYIGLLVLVKSDQKM